MRRREPIETKHAMAALCEMKGRRAAHRPKPDDENSAHCAPQVIFIGNV
jgi:hypothetical protein